jgi:hypothetical protein
MMKATSRPIHNAPIHFPADIRILQPPTLFPIRREDKGATEFALLSGRPLTTTAITGTTSKQTSN